MELAKATIRVFLASALLVVILLLFDRTKRLLFMVVMITVNCLFAFLKHKLLRKLSLPDMGYLRQVSNAVELITFTTVMGTHLFGPMVGMISGALSMAGTYVFEKRISKFSLATVPMYAALGSAIAFLPAMDIRLVGSLAAIIYNVGLTALLMAVFTIRISKMLAFSIPNILFNIYIFYTFSRIFTSIF